MDTHILKTYASATGVMTVIVGIWTLLTMPWPQGPLQPAPVPAPMQASPEPLVPQRDAVEARWPLTLLPEERRVRVIPITRPPPAPEPPAPVAPAPVPTPVAAQADQPAMPVPPRRKRMVVSDVCMRHGMQKVHYGRTWRCRKK